MHIFRTHACERVRVKVLLHSRPLTGDSHTILTRRRVAIGFFHVFAILEVCLCCWFAKLLWLSHLWVNQYSSPSSLYPPPLAG